MKNVRKIHIFAVSLLCALILLAMAAAASSERFSIEDFSDPAARWTAGENVSRLNITSNGVAGTTRTCLEVVGKTADVGLIRSAVAKFPEPVDLGEYRTASCEIYVPTYEADENAHYFTRLTLYAEDGSSAEALTSIKGGKWGVIKLDMASFSGRSRIVSAEVAVLIDTDVPKAVSSTFYIGNIYATDAIDHSMAARFLFDRYSVSGARAQYDDEKNVLTLESDSFAPMNLSANLFVPQYGYNADRLKIKLANYTDNSTMTVYYTAVGEGAVTEDKSVTVDILPQSDARSYYVDVGDAAMLQSIRLLFDEGNGAVELVSISAVPSYTVRQYEACGRITSCTLTDGGKTVRFSGEVRRDTALRSREGAIEIYAVPGVDSFDIDSLGGLTPVVTGSMTTRFELTWTPSADNPHAKYNCFVAVTKNNDGTLSLIDKPFYISDFNKPASNSQLSWLDGKGFAADDISEISDIGAGLTLAEVDLTRAFTEKSAGEQLIYNGCAYYIDGGYLSGIGERIAVLKALDIGVVLRLCGWNTEFAGALSERYSQDAYVSYTSSADIPDGNDFIGAISAYAAEKWCKDGGVCGVILGKGENILSPDIPDVNDNIALDAKHLRTVYYNFTAADARIKVYISVTSLFDEDAYYDMSEFPMCEYLPALLIQTDTYGSFDWNVAVEVSPYGDANSETRISPDNCKELAELFRENECYGKTLLFCDDIYTFKANDEFDPAKDYIIGYLSAVSSDMIDGYIAVCERADIEFFDVVKYIDTSRADSVIKTVLADQSRLDAYDKDILPVINIGEGSASLTRPEDIRGEYKYFVFDTVSKIDNISSGYYYENPEIVKDNGLALSVHLDRAVHELKTLPRWLGITHTYEIPESFRHTPIIALTMKLDGITPSDVSGVDIKLVLTGGRSRFEIPAVIPAGQWTTVYFDIENFKAIKNVDRLEVLVGNSRLESATLHIERISGLSSEYNNESLAKAIAEDKVDRDGDAFRFGRDHVLFAVCAVLSVITVIVAVLLGKKHDEGDS